MSNMTKLKFIALDIYENNNFSWIIDAKIHLEAVNPREIIKEENNASLQDHAKAMTFICHHLHKGLKIEYLIRKNYLVLWPNL